MRNQSILAKEITPLSQALGVAGLLLVLNLIAYLVQLSGVDLGTTTAWEISLTCILFFALTNALFFLNTKDKNKYWTHSTMAYLGLVIFSLVIAGLISGIWINESGSIKWIYFVFTFGYLVFVSIIGLMRKIVEIVIRQDRKLRGEE